MTTETTETTETTPQTIALLGLGAMGSRMAARLLDHTPHRLRVYNRTASRAEALVARGATAHATPAEAARGADVVINMVTDDDAARHTLLDPTTGALHTLEPGALVIESSTTTPAWIAALADACDRAQLRLLDAPVLGTRPQAEAGALIYLVGGDAATLAEAMPTLRALGGAFHHVGPPGAGAAMKLAVNASLGVQVAALAEHLGHLQRQGVPAATARALLAQLPTTSPALQGILRLLDAGTFDPLFPVHLVAKDLRYATGPNTPITAAAFEVFSDAIQAGFGDLNIHAVSKIYESK